MVGEFGVRSYFVTQRTQEIGIRMALGAAAGDVLGLVVGRGLLLALIGIGAGVAAAVPLMQWRRELLFGIEPTDPWTFAAAIVLMAAIAALASYLPARRAARVSPMVALKAE
jgi:putative ABC transport system permease protein